MAADRRPQDYLERKRILLMRGRKNEKNADRAALLAIEASRVIKEAEPQLTLRFYEGMDSRLMEKALETIGEGRTYPMLYNDDANIPAGAMLFVSAQRKRRIMCPLAAGNM